MQRLAQITEWHTYFTEIHRTFQFIFKPSGFPSHFYILFFIVLPSLVLFQYEFGDWKKWNSEQDTCLDPVLLYPYSPCFICFKMASVQCLHI